MITPDRKAEISRAESGGADLKNTTAKSHQVFSLKARTLIFLAFILFFSIIGLGLMFGSQDKITSASQQIRQVLLPAGRLFEEAKGELDLQAQELALLAQSEGKTQITPQDLGLLRLGPSVKSLMQLHESPLMPSALKPLSDPWAKAVKQYQEEILTVKSLPVAINKLHELRQKTHLLHRAIDREFSVQLLKLAETVHEYGRIWSFAFIVSALATLGFLLLMWRWMSPLEKMKRWLESYTSLQGNSSFLAAPPPPSAMGSGILAPPREVQDLVDAMRFHLTNFKDLARELSIKSERNNEAEKAMGTLFASLHFLVRNNEELLAELIRNERLASMGEMAAQLAHEIRNPLNSLNLKLEMLREDLAPAQQEQLDKVLNEIDRLDALTESHLRTTKHATYNGVTQKVENINNVSSPLHVINDVLEVLRPELEAHGISTEVKHSLSSDLRIAVPENVLKAALLNLLKNAYEASCDSRAKGKHIVVEITEIPDSQNPSISLSVLDLGCGFDETWMKQPFKTFHTTKKSGSGLGLATSKKMLSAYGVELDVSTTPPAPYSSEVKIRAKTFKESENAKSADTNPEFGLT